MKVIGRNVLDDFGRNHADVRSRINSWLCEVEDAQWQNLADLKRRYPHASILPDQAQNNKSGFDFQDGSSCPCHFLVQNRAAYHLRPKNRHGLHRDASQPLPILEYLASPSNGEIIFDALPL